MARDAARPAARIAADVRRFCHCRFCGANFRWKLRSCAGRCGPGGIGESAVQEKIQQQLAALVGAGLEVGYCARPGQVDVRLTARGVDAEKIVRAGEAVVQKILGANIYGFDDEEIEQVVVRLLTEKKKPWRWRNPAPAAASPTA